MPVKDKTMKRRWQAFLCLLAVAALPVGCRKVVVEPQGSPTVNMPEKKLDADVVKLLDLKSGKESIADFVRCLETLAQKHAWYDRYAACKKLSLFGWTEGRALPIQSDQDQSVVVLLNSSTSSIPGIDRRTLILLDGQGRFLDFLACDINSRLTMMEAGKFLVVIPEKPEADGAQLVVRLENESARGNFAHKLNHRGETSEYYWGHDHLRQDQPTIWDTKGLCRLAIRNGRLEILFPGEEYKRKR